MSGARLSSSPRIVALSASGVIATGVLIALAVRADSGAPHASPWLTAVDVAVGVAFVAAGVLAGGPLSERVLVAAVGPAWLAGSLLVAARPLHQAMLAVALVAFPGGRVRGAASWVLVTLAGLTALQFMSQLGVAALFAVIAVVALARSRYRPNHRVPAHAAQRPDSPLTHLTPRERDILALMTEGRSNSGIAGELGISDEPSRRPAPSPSPADAQ